MSLHVCIYLMLLALYKPVIGQPYQLKCQQNGRNVDIIEIQAAIQQVAICQILNEDDVVVDFQLEDFNLELTAYNSTWNITYQFTTSTEKTEWNLTLPVSDFFCHLTDFDDPPALSPLHTHRSLKWLATLKACHRMLEKCVVKNMALIHKESEILTTRNWGNLLAILPVDINQIFTQDTHVINVKAPCQPGTSMVILSSRTKTYFVSTLNSYADQTVRWHQWNCSLADLAPPCSDARIHNAYFVNDVMLFVTSDGLLASDSLDNVEVSYEKVTLAQDNLVWSSIQLVSSPLCSNLDQILPQGNIVLLRGSLPNGDQVLYSASPPYRQWALLKHFSTPINLVTVAFDSQTSSIIAITDDLIEQRLQSNVHLLSDLLGGRTSPKYEPFTLNATGPCRNILLSNHFLYLAVGPTLWLSTDGGHFYKRLVTLDAADHIIEIIGYEPRKSFAFLSSRGTVWFGQAGLSEAKLVLQIGPVLRGRKFLSFNHIGDLFVIDTETTLGVFPSRTAIDVGHQITCSYNLTQQSVMHSIQSGDLGTTVEYSVSVYRKPTELLAPQPWILVTFGNPRIFLSEVTRSQLSPYHLKVTIRLTSQYLIQGLTSVAMNLRLANESCPITSHNVIVMATCPRHKKLQFTYSSFLRQVTPLTVEQFVALEANASKNLLVDLPTNYRPPSSMAVSIPISSNVYNVHPSLLNQSSASSQYGSAAKLQLKRFCAGRSKRSECSCTSANKFSSLAKYSDCKEKAYKVTYDTFYHIKLSISTAEELTVANMTSEPISDVSVEDMSQYLVYLEEVNGRDESVYTADDNAETFCLTYSSYPICQVRQGTPSSAQLLHFMTSGRSKSVYNASELSIKFQGSGLFHFRVRVIAGLSFCDLQDEFQVYVINPPLPFPTGTIIRLAVSFAMGTVMIVIYMKFLFSKPIEKKDEAGSAFSKEGTGIQRASFRRTTSYVAEDDIKAIRSKLRSSFQS